jgi:hypothetical protein
MRECRQTLTHGWGLRGSTPHLDFTTKLCNYATAKRKFMDISPNNSARKLPASLRPGTALVRRRFPEALADTEAELIQQNTGSKVRSHANQPIRGKGAREAHGLASHPSVEVLKMVPVFSAGFTGQRAGS